MKDEFKSKHKSKRFTISMRTDQQDPLSSIDLTSVLTKLSSLYYKTDLLNSVAIAINQGVDFENIWILRKSLKKTTVVPNTDNISIINNIEFFYRHGFFQGLSPNKDFYEINILMDSFKQINKTLYQYDRKTLYIRQLSNFIKMYYKKGFVETIKEMTISSTFFNTNDENLMFIRMIKSIFERAISKQKNFSEDIDDIEKVMDLLSKKIEDIEIEKTQVSFGKQNRVEKKYLEPFFEIFNYNDFPIIMIDEGNKIDFLCSYHLKKSNFNNPFFFDIKEVSHNSPTLIVLSVALNLISPLLIAYLGFLNAQKIYWEKEKNKEEAQALRKKRRDPDIAQRQLNEINEMIERYSVSDKIYDENILDEVNKIKSIYYREQLIDISENIKNEYEYLIKDYSFIISDSKYE